MNGSRAAWLLLLTLLLAVSAVRPQPAPQNSAAGFGNPFDNVAIRKYWNPVVGSGAVFEVTQPNGKKATSEYDILSKETVDGKPAYWLGFAAEGSDFKGKIYGKILVIPDGYQARKLILQLPGTPAMEFPIAPEAQNADTKSTARLVGTESITVPGGTFQCEHWRDADGTNAWVNAKIAPLRIVKVKIRTKRGCW
jgi:hypothetical protein